MKTIAIIPARGGSERLPNKNIKMLGGLPLLAHSIVYAKQQDVIDAVYVSTNDAEIKAVALEHGAEVIDRPEVLSEAHSTTISALTHALEVLDSEIDHIVLLQPTNPLRPQSLFKTAFTCYISGAYDSLMTVSRNIHKLGTIKNDKFVPYNYTIGQRSQDLEPLYYENGLLYIINASLIAKGELLGVKHKPYIVEHPYAEVDIDTLEDFEYAEYLLHKNSRK